MRGITNVEDVVFGLGEDLSRLRSGEISVAQAKASADLAQQYMAGIRLMIKARKSLEEQTVAVGIGTNKDKESL